MSVKNKLNRFKANIIRDDSVRKSSEVKNQSPRATINNIEEWESTGARPYFYEDQYCLIREVHYPLEYQHGKYKLGEVLKAIHLWNEGKIEHPLSSAGHQPSDLFFFDTETTGIYGGTGNIIFLLGYARVYRDKVVLTQHFLPEPGSETALYKSFLEKVDYRTLVTYNGKSFDWPQVKTRHTLVREHVPKLPAFGHFDLYHGSRRLWKGTLPSVKLSKVEEEVLEFYRKDDIPGYLAPMIYFDYVERKETEGIFQVLKHNEQDILSLITLYTHLTYHIHSVMPDSTVTEQVRVAEWFQSLGEKNDAKNGFQQAAKEGSITAKYHLGFYFKREKTYEKALEIWMEVVQSQHKYQFQACIEVAKLLEHQFKDINEAIVYTKKALELLKLHERPNIQQEAEKRLRRLFRKLEKC